MTQVLAVVRCARVVQFHLAAKTNSGPSLKSSTIILFVCLFCLQKAHDMLKKAWDAEGSPFKGTPFDPTRVQISGDFN